MSVDSDQFRENIVRPVLKLLESKGVVSYSADAEELLMGTAAQESQLGTYVTQMGNGPAKGPFQMEGATHDDIWINYLEYKDDLAKVVGSLVLSAVKEGGKDYASTHMMGNWYYAVAMARCHYLRKSGAIPSTLEGQAAYWKEHYNTPLGAGTPEEYIENYHRYVD